MTVQGNITKKDIVEEIASRTGLTQVDTKVIIESFLDAIAKSLTEGKNIEIRGFGRFKLRMREARTARNPRTGEKVNVDAQIRPIFEPSRELKKLFNSLPPDSIILDKIEGEEE
ncbi:MAG: integration host factor subunit beta [Fibrobacteraceae bacterium]|nr:integration host factor subunit beta [Fibrobacteraceae bacterium]